MKLAYMVFKFILLILFDETTWNERRGIENVATNLFIPEHCSFLKILNHFIILEKSKVEFCKNNNPKSCRNEKI